MRAVIVDDEHYALVGLQTELERIEGMEVVGAYENGHDFLSELKDKKPDIIFLDIEMPEYTGFDLFAKVMEIYPLVNIVFVTAFNEYAIQAFELNALDYILKPATNKRLEKTIQRLKPLSQVPQNKIKIQCFRRLSFFMNEVELNLEWRTKKALELLAYLIYEKGKFISKEKIAEALWPGLDGEKSISNLYLAYYYIKKQEKVAGITIPVESERGKIRICLDKVDCDITEFDKHIESCKVLNEENISFAEKAESLYLGQLFEDGYYEWTTNEQQKYEIIYDNLINSIINYYSKTGNAAKYNLYKQKYCCYLNR